MLISSDFNIKDFDYDLPPEKIAQFPLEKRDSSKLLTWKNGMIGEDLFSRISQHLPKKSFIVFNDTKVVRARLIFAKSTGATIEIFCLEPYQNELVEGFSATGSSRWECLVGNSKRWRTGRLDMRFTAEGRSCILFAEKKEDLGEGRFVVEFSWNPIALTFAEVLEKSGRMPLPPYIHRMATEKDTMTYQTVYAKQDGSVAAPTAGLHFTKSLLERLGTDGYLMGQVTLHVGLGTFRPVASDDISLHTMHEERIQVSEKLIQNLKDHLGKPVIAVGTTSVRTLESIYWLGCRLILDQPESWPDVEQWLPYQLRYDCGIPAEEALKAIIDRIDKEKLNTIHGRTKLMIIPGYHFRLVDGMITNFHQPRSTLLMLVAAFTGNDWQKIYRYALSHDFRFLSYGDACFFLKVK